MAKKVKQVFLQDRELGHTLDAMMLLLREAKKDKDAKRVDEIKTLYIKIFTVFVRQTYWLLDGN